LFDRDQPLVGLRGQNQRTLRSSSSVRALLSIQPNASASVTASSYGTLALPVCVCHDTSHTPVLDA
jgi:hypothetical protein